MKQIFIFIAVYLFSSLLCDVYAQLVSPTAFNKIVKQDIGNLIGGSTAARGLKLDLAKPEATITGRIPSRRGIISLDLGLGVIDNKFTLFSSNKFNTNWYGRVNYIYIPDNWGKFNNTYDYPPGTPKLDSLNLNIDDQISQSANLWTRKRLRWFSFTGEVINSKFNNYLTIPKKLVRDTIWGGGIKIDFNYININLRNRDRPSLFFAKGGVEFKSVNNVSQLKKEDYVTSKLLYTDTTGMPIYKEERGVMYIDSIKSAFAFNPFVEVIYHYNYKSFIPGLYFRSDFTLSSVLQNSVNWSSEFGLIFNILSNDEKDKNYISVVPFIKINNIFKTVDRDGEELSLRERSTIGLRIGVPIGFSTQ